MSTISSGTTLTTALVQTGDTTGTLIIKTNNGNTTAATFSTGGNLTFGATGARIQGDFSNATIANRVAFQTSTTNGGTVVPIIPNGTSTDGRLWVLNNSDATNAGLAQIIANNTEVSIRSSQIGSGTNLPLTMYTGGSERLRIDTSGNVGIGTASPSQKLDVAGSAIIGNTSGNQGLSIGNASGNSAAYLNYLSSSAVVNWQVGSNIINAGSLTFTPSTATGGSTFTTAAGRFDSSSNFYFNSGYGSAAVAYGCRAWILFDGTGTPSINASGNFSSITDTGTGSYSLNFTTAMPDANYAAAVSTTQGDFPSYNYMVTGFTMGGSSTTSAQILVRPVATSDTKIDLNRICVSIFR